MSQDNKATAYKTLAMEISPPTRRTYTNKTSEEKANLSMAKLNLNSARNLKTEIKITVLHAIERLYELVKEAEADNKAKIREAGEGTEKDGSTTSEAQSTWKDDK